MKPARTNPKSNIRIINALTSNRVNGWLSLPGKKLHYKSFHVDFILLISNIVNSNIMPEWKQQEIQGIKY
jgi:hypothetical protein